MRVRGCAQNPQEVGGKVIETKRSTLLMLSARALAAVLVSCAAVLGVSAAAAAPTATNVHVFIGAAPTPVPSDRLIPPTPNGGTKSIAGLRFFALPHVANTGPDPATFRVRFELAPGLRFATGRPDVDAEKCSSTPTVAECRVTDPLPPGSEEVGWQWEIVAERSGSYAMRAEVLDLSTTDSDLADNTTTITVVLSATEGGGGSGEGGGGGGSAAATATAAKLTPAKPKAGTAVLASVRVHAGGAPVRPTRVACIATVGSLKLRGAPRAASGQALCTFRTPSTANGELLRGSVAFTARGQRFTKRFSARLG
jgi:hypothetical protein